MPEPLLPLAFGVAASAATYFGGWLTLRLRGQITLVLALAAGIVLGLALFDLIPQAIALVGNEGDVDTAFLYVALGFGVYLLLDRLLDPKRAGAASWRAHLGPASLTLHSLLDGMMIGIAFQVSHEVGWLIAAAVLTHDMADGFNTVTLSLARSGLHNARRWLLINGAAPLLGVAAGLLLDVPPAVLGPMLAAFGGVFLYIGACELVPRSHAADPRFRVALVTLAGMALMLGVVHLAH